MMMIEINAPYAGRMLKEDPVVGASRRRLYAERQAARFAQGLPKWAVRYPGRSNREVAYLVDPDQFYPQLLDELGVTKPTRYHIECAYQMMKMDMQVAHGAPGFTIHVRADGERKRKWNLTMFPGRDQDVLDATGGLEARAHYLRLRGFLPRFH